MPQILSDVEQLFIQDVKRLDGEGSGRVLALVRVYGSGEVQVWEQEGLI